MKSVEGVESVESVEGVESVESVESVTSAREGPSAWRAREVPTLRTWCTQSRTWNVGGEAAAMTIATRTIHTL